MNRRSHRKTDTRHRHGAAALVLSLATGGCIDRPVAVVPQVTQYGVSAEIQYDGVEKVDLLLVVDNSGSMRVNQANIARQLPRMIARLTSPPDENGDGRPDHAPVKDLHVSIVSTNLGAPGSAFLARTCGDRGDDGVTNPARRGAMQASHNPPNDGDRADCPAASELPDVLSFVAGETDAAQFNRQFRCAALLGTQGCGLEAPLEAVHRALRFYDARDGAPASSPNAGFLRDDALLAIVVLTDEEDGSARDCRFAAPGEACDDAIEVYADRSTRFPEANIDQRFYRYEPGSASDPTWALERYVNPRDARAGWLALKPGHPERVIFAAIAGVPRAIPMRPDGSVEWDQLLGAPGEGATREDFTRRVHTSAVDGRTELGTFSMRANNPDPAHPGYVVPACRRSEGTESYAAYPSRRVVEVARRFDESALCNNGPCRNGVIASVCGDDFAPAVDRIVSVISARVAPPCLPRRLEQHEGARPGSREVACLVRELAPSGQGCDPAAGRVPVLDEAGAPRVERAPDGTERALCDLRQLATNESSEPLAGEDGATEGWFYRTSRTGGANVCPQNIEFTASAQPRRGSVLRLECVQSTAGAGGTTSTSGAAP